MTQGLKKSGYEWSLYADDEESSVDAILVSISNDAIEGNDVGICFYFEGWLLIGVIFMFALDPALLGIINYYMTFDIFCLLFVLLHLFYLRKKHTDKNYKFLRSKDLTKREVFKATIYILIFLVIIGFVGFLCGALFISGNMKTHGDSSYYLLYITRYVFTEELFFRGLILFSILVFFQIILRVNKDPSSLEEVSYVWRKKICSVAAVILSSVIFMGFHYTAYEENPGALITIFLLGILCGILALRFGIWASMVLHLGNNILAYVFYYSTNFNTVDSGLLLLPFFFLIAFISLFLLVRKINYRKFMFDYFATAFVLFFIFGFYTNGLLKSSWLFGIYFEHYHFILLLPGIYILFRYKFNNVKLYSLLLGVCAGLFISDLRDIVSLNGAQISTTLRYFIVFLIVYIFIGIFVKLKNRNKYYKEYEYLDGEIVPVKG